MATTSSNPEANDSQVSDALAISNFNFSDPLMREAAKLRVSAGKDEYEFGKKKAELTQKTMQPLIEEERAGRAKFAERQKEVTDQMTKPFEVPQPMMADFASLGGMLAVTASMLGHAGKQPASQAMAAMTGVLDGFQKGRKDLVDRSFKEFDANMKRLQALQKAIDVELNAYVEGMKLNQQGAQLNLQTMIAIAYDGAIAAKLKNASAQDVIQIGMNSRQLAQSAKIASDRLAVEKTRWDAEQTQKQAKDARTPVFYDDKRKVWLNADRQVIPGSENLTRTPPKASDATSSLGGNYVDMLKNIYPEGYKPPSKENDARKIFEQINAIRSTQNLIDKAKDPAIVFGEIPTLKVKIAALWDRNINQMFKDIPQNTELSDYQVQQVINKTLSDFQQANNLSDIDKNLVFQKDNTFTGVELEKALVGGKPTVFMLRNMGPLLNAQTQSEAAWREIWNDRLKQVKRNVPLPPQQLDMALGKLNSAEQIATGKTEINSTTTQKPVYLNNREIVVVNGRWVYKDTQQPVEQ